MKTRFQTGSKPKPVYVWVWLPGQIEPVVGGVITSAMTGDGLKYSFSYGQSYLSRDDAVSIFTPELPLQTGGIHVSSNSSGLTGCLRDAMPDAWGRRVIVNRLTGNRKDDIETADFNETIYMLHSGSDRIGAIDFQESASQYIPRDTSQITIEALIEAAGHVEAGEKIPDYLDQAVFHSSSIGGARPKGMIDTEDGKFIVKFPSSTDVFPVIKWEYVAMRLATLSGLDVAPVEMRQIPGKEVLMIKRFDRKAHQHKHGQWERRFMVSALTVLGLDEMTGRYASYEDLAEKLRLLQTSPKRDLTELFSRITFNILCGNTDDHARNHALFWDGNAAAITPAYDICPQRRTGQIASQAMLIHGDDKSSRLTTCLEAAPTFLLTKAEAKDIIENQVEVIMSNFSSVCDEARLGSVDRSSLMGRQFLNPFAFDDWPTPAPDLPAPE